MTSRLALILPFALAVGSLQASAQQATPLAEPAPVAEASAARGSLVAIGGQFQSSRAACVQCHGLEGLSDLSGAFPRLAGLDSWYIYKSLRDYAAGLRNNPTMISVARRMTDTEMQDVAAHYGSFQDLPYRQADRIAADMRQQGGAIVAVGLPEKGVAACSSCHGENGVGNGLIYPRIAGQYAPYLERQLHKWKRGQRDGDPLNVMERIAKGMSVEDIRAVSIYLAAVDPLAVEPPPEDPPALPDTDLTPAPPYLDRGGSKSP